MTRILLAALAAAGLAAPAWAQSGASFDCAKASNTIERTICARPELAQADRTLAAVYAALAGKLSGAAKDHLVKDQVAWIAARNKACTGDTEEIARCLKDRYVSRTQSLRVLERGTYPFVSQQTLLKQGKVGKVTYSIDVAWPQFDGPTADFSKLNSGFARLARKAADESIPDRQAGADAPFDQTWEYGQSFTLQRPSADAVAVAITYYGYAGGAHGFGGTTAYLVDLRTGQAVPPAGVFAKGDAWLKALVPLVRADLKKQFDEGKPGFDDALETNNLVKLLREPEHYYYRQDKLELIFDAYVVGPYVSGPFTVEIPYSKLKPLFAADGPLGSLR
ncbi:MAG: DUF3298 domain-containing protein [Proteobacteria bacterium]|nr:DUF3298 domain-containing protein [Pseudomonadota bacterium]